MNAPPRVAIVASLPLRVEAGDELELKAEVEDAETPLDQMVYGWLAEGLDSTFSAVAGNPRHVKWVAPRGIAPGAFAFKLLVIERYYENGVPKTHEISALSPLVHYNDSPAELTRLGIRFITELFSNFAVTPAEAVQDFSDSCPGKLRELADVERNRRDFRILSGTYSNLSITMNTDRTRATVSGRCVFRDIPNSGPNAGQIQRVEGTCNLAAIYERWNWFLCDSTFKGSGSLTRESLRYRVPGLVE